MKRIATFLPALSLALFALAGAAKLPPLSEEEKAKAAETKSRSEHTDKMAAYKLCKSMDKVAADYFAQAKKAGRQTAAAVPTPPCTDPGPFAGAKPPLEAAGAHSPPKPAAEPPSTPVPHADQPKK